MDKSLRIDVGERYLVLGVFTTLVTETVYQLLTAGMFFTWPSLIVGVVSVLAIIFLANWLYTGSLQARKVALAWVSLQLLWVVGGLGLLLSGSPTGPSTARLMGVNIVWLACIKLAAYTLFGSILCFSDSLNAFLGYKRGEEIPERVRAEIKGEPMELPKAHEEVIDDLAGTMQAAALTLIVVGLLQMLVAFRDMPTEQARNLGLARGLVVLALGAILFLPLGALRALIDDPERNTGYLTRALSSLTAMTLLQALLGLGLGAVIVGSVLLGVVL
jgi:hypothetical protein